MTREDTNTTHKTHKTNNTTLPWQITTIINVCHELRRTGRSGASCGERIAAALVLNRPDYLPHGYEHLMDAWERLDDWQVYVKRIHRDYRHLIE